MQELSKDDIWQAVEFVKKNESHHMAYTKSVLKFQISVSNSCWKICDENLLETQSLK